MKSNVFSKKNDKKKDTIMGNMQNTYKKTRATNVIHKKTCIKR